MARNSHRSKAEYYRAVAALYQQSGRPPTTSRKMLRWAKSRGLEEPPEVDVEGIQARELTHVMREQLAKDPQGRMARVNHCYPHEVRRDGEVVQEELWGTFDTLTREQVHASFQQRRSNILGDCKQLSTDNDSFNENHNPGDPIQLSFAFEEDLLELNAPDTF